ncbi:hypothetical protein [Neptunicoccus cionae]|uniref:hypothetical protein n=1 Tax=Neptunicoccus cionae TaxID=2035344 RepID=UPI000C770330|nr:hypothetical protein [Amylibacter cionae]PLS21350.1 hypothetical protein C0U40_11150 [Amylibacter cionae]
MALQADYSPASRRGSKITGIKDTKQDQSGEGGAVRFATLVVVSTGVMFGIMHLNSFALDHMQGAQTLMWLAVYIGGSAALVSLGLLAGIFTHPKANIAIVAGSLLAFGIGVGIERLHPSADVLAQVDRASEERQKAETTAHRIKIEKIESYVTEANYKMRPSRAKDTSVPG